MKVAIITLCITFALCIIIVIVGRISKAQRDKVARKEAAEKLESWYNGKNENEANPESCEREPEEDEILVPLSFFAPGNDLTGWIKYDKYWSERCRASLKGYKNIVVKTVDYEEALAYQMEKRREKKLSSATVSLNNYAIELEKCGEIDGAIATYEENIKLRYPAHHSYKRLMVLYRKRKDKENEIRIINIALEVFPNNEEYRERLEKLLQKK